ncbi:STM4015 family protein [Yinghuangia seranimata]|uniref:STM4015 family protein n=1 Tax=Yinghuangia seranimata TaxID=408067 RepID=UPI00248C40B9|nr:STM4015 family protein [Yinghuangia seranimata]MDI2131670.1 STM4015 family protein [Yinghuangia seranimata]
MSIHDHLAELGGLAVRPFLDFDVIDGWDEDDDRDERFKELFAGLPDAGAVAWKVGTYFDAEIDFAEAFSMFLDAVDTTRVRALVLGYWDTDILDDADPVVPLLVEHADRFPALRHLFIGDIVMEEHEISWIPPEDLTALLAVYPDLEEVGLRFGRRNFREPQRILTPLRHERLRRLVLQTGGMPAEVVRAVGACDLPAVEELELWLGVEEYGGDATAADLAELLSGSRLPALRHLGLMNSEIQDDVCAAVAGAAVVARLTSLDLSMGTLSDTGVEALLAGQPLTHLQRLSLRHHFVSEEAAERVHRTLVPAGVQVDLSDRQTPWDDAETPEAGRYTEVAE